MNKKVKNISGSPFALKQYVQSLLPKKGKSKTLPNLILRKEGITISKGKAKEYAALCGLNFDGKNIPAIFPHIMAFPLHMELLLDKNFPFQIVGMVHISNTITEYRSIALDDKLTIEVSFDDMQEHAKGKMIPIITKFYNGYGELVWESRSENLKITKKSESKGKKTTTPVIEGTTEQWSLDTYAGLRYAKVAGDINPIHLFPITAKAFGFKRHIIHGMWTKAKAVAALQEQIRNKPYTVKVDFKLPVFLPAKINFTHQTTKDGINFEVRDKNNEKPHVKGSVRFL